MPAHHPAQARHPNRVALLISYLASQNSHNVYPILVYILRNDIWHCFQARGLFGEVVSQRSPRSLTLILAAVTLPARRDRCTQELQRYSDHPRTRNFSKAALRNYPDAKSLPLLRGFLRNTRCTSTAVTWALHPLFVPVAARAPLRREPFAMCISARALVVTPAASGSVTCHEHLAPNA